VVVPANIQRLRQLYQTAPGTPIVAASDPVVSFTNNLDGAASLTTNGVAYDMRNPYIRRLGGTWVPQGTTYPSYHLMKQETLHYRADLAKVAGGSVIELLIDQNTTTIEWKGTSCVYVGVMVDGQMSSANGITPTPGFGGKTIAYVSQKIELTPSSAPRRVRIYFIKNATVGHITLNEGGKLLDPAIGLETSVVFAGDSITEGAVATRQFHYWCQRAARAIGFDNIGNMGVGGTGWLKAITTGDKFATRVPDILTFNNGGPPDLLVIALGINDDGSTEALRSGITAEVAVQLAALRAGAPDMPIIVFGNFTGNGPYTDYLNKQEAIFKGCQGIPLVYTVPVDSWWSDSAVYSTWYNGQVNGPHPTDAGHAAIGTLATRAILDVLGRL
jgi:lysophospholipase L1-like esterase